MNIGALFNIKKDLNAFKSNHPKLVPEVKKVLSKGFCEDQEIAVAIRYPDGTEVKTGIRLQETDLPFFETIKAFLER